MNINPLKRRHLECFVFFKILSLSCSRALLLSATSSDCDIRIRIRMFSREHSGHVYMCDLTPSRVNGNAAE